MVLNWGDFMRESKKDFLTWEKELLDYLKPTFIVKDYKLDKMIPVKLYGFNSLNRNSLIPEITYCKEFENNQSTGCHLKSFFQRSELIRFYEQWSSFSFIKDYIKNAAKKPFVTTPIDISTENDVFLIRYIETYRKRENDLFDVDSILEALERLQREYYTPVFTYRWEGL